MRNKKSLLDKNIIFMLLIFSVFAVTGYAVFTKIKSDEITMHIERNEIIPVSFNISKDGNLLLSELVIINPGTRKTAVFNIPANYGSIIETISKIDRIDILFNYSNPDKYLNKLTGITEIPVDYYINIELDNLVKVVDIISGLEMFIPDPVEIVDNDQILLLPSGSIVLDGEKTVTLLVYDSEDENDADLIGRWHKFIQSFIKKSGESAQLFDNKKTYELFYSYFRTNLSRDAMKTLIKLFNIIDSDQFVFQRIIGDKKNIDGQELLFPYYGGSLLKETIKQTLTAISSEVILGDETSQTRVEIQNGTSIPGLAGRTSHFFNNLGYEVISVKNADRNDYEQTVIIANSLNALAAQQVANMIRCVNIEIKTDEEIMSELNGSDYNTSDRIDVIVILGKDFDGRYCR